MITVRADEVEYLTMGGSNEGACLSCGEWVDGVEPDARRYPCPACGEEEVYGFQELLMMGELDIMEED